MNLYWRLFITLLKGYFRSPNPPLHGDERFYRVMPWDIDILGHMNNGRYLQICDVARMGWMQRAGILKPIVGNRWGAVLGGTMARYCKSLKPWQRFKVHTRLMCWDHRWFYIEHRFVSLRGENVAIFVTRAALRSKKGWVPTQQVVDVVEPGLQSPAFTQLTKQWLAADESMLQATRPVSVALKTDSDVITQHCQRKQA